ncbi:spidroin-2-like isoform X2 [Oncorhynchus nerka]|uniref:spidroin-2-like isoform X2 n=1 Tax=Oncorhynchus nerka TaxID=8023 RepID=UPI0011316EE3|nr:spidroin-2-like isoform X2 [Oncorhynchus nerka]
MVKPMLRTEVQAKAMIRTNVKTKGERGGHKSSIKKNEKPPTPLIPPTQLVSYEGWAQNPDRPNSRQRDLIVHDNGEVARPRMPIKRSQKPGSPKPGSQKPGSPKPWRQKPGSQKPGSPKPGSQKPGSPKPGSQKPGSQKPWSPKPGSQKPGSPKPWSPKHGSQKPGSPKPGSQKPGNQKTCKKGSTKNGKEWAKKNQDTTRSKELRKSTTDHDTYGPIPVMAGPYLDVVRRSAADCESVLPSAQENATLAPGAMELRTGPGGPGAHPRNHCWSNPAENVQACGTSYHICRRPLTDYPVYAHDYTLPRAKDKHQDLYQDESLKQDPSPQGVSLSVTDVDLCNPNVS